MFVNPQHTPQDRYEMFLLCELPPPQFVSAGVKVRAHTRGPSAYATPLYSRSIDKRIRETLKKPRAKWLM